MPNPSFGRRAGAALLATLFATQSACSGSTNFGSTAQQEGSRGPGDTAPPGEPPPLPRYPDGSVVPATTPIKLGGGGGVSDTGAATYSLPLWLPEGPRGMQPSLSIDYSGGGGNGHLGSGMSLSGLSAIAPCAQTFASEGFADGVDHDAHDSYCLDGMKLVEFDDPDYPAVPGVARVYHTEIETFSRVIAHLDSDHVQPVGFEVHGRDGDTHTYAPRYASPLLGISATELGQALGERIAFVYLLERSEDRNGNRVDYLWENADATLLGETSYRIHKISYSYAGSSTARRWVRFLYQQRLDDLVRYVRGVKLVNRSLVTTIQVFAPNPTATSHVWSYHLGYVTSPDTGDSLLSSVQMCAQLGSCSYVRRFEWTEGDGSGAIPTTVSDEVEFDDASMSRSLDFLTTFHANFPDLNWFPSTDVRVLLFDVDNDGDDDALYRTAPTFATVTVEGTLENPGVGYACNMGTIKLRTSTDAPLAQVEDVSDDFERSHELWNYDCVADQIAHLGKSRIADFDGDGALDLQLAKTLIDPLEHEEVEGTIHGGWWTYGFETSSFVDGHWEFLDNELPATDAAMHGPAAIGVWGGNGFSQQPLLRDPPFQRVIADLDGDGVVETIDAVWGVNILAHADVDWNDPFAFHNGGFPYVTKVSSSGSVTWLQQDWTCGNGRARVADLYADGRDDVVVTNETVAPGYYRHLSLSDYTGTAEPHGEAEIGGTAELWAGDCGPEVENNPDLTMGDWNGDGLVDALYPPGSYQGNLEPLVRWNLGAGFGPLEPMLVHDSGSSSVVVTNADLRQDAPTGRDDHPVPWDRGTRTADVNDDGRTDIIAFREDVDECVNTPLEDYTPPHDPDDFDCTSRVFVFLSAGDHFEGHAIYSAGQSGASLSMGFTTSQVGDVTGDGAEDLVLVVNGSLKVLELQWRNTPDRLLRVTDGSTPFPLETFEYTRHWWGDGNKPDVREGGCPFPLGCSYRGAEVVRQHQIFAGTDDAGAPMFRTFLHHFQGARYDRRGRGSLGMEEHRIWDRELGSETIRRFDNDHEIDPDGDAMGGKFYPYAHRPKAVTTVVPVELLPTAAELASPSDAPGLAASVNVRITRTTTSYEVRDSEEGRILTVLPTVTTTYVGDRSATLDLDGEIPTYGSVALPESVATYTVTSEYDDRGNLTSVRSQTEGGVTRETRTTFFDDIDAWHLGLPTRIALTSYDTDDVDYPTRVVRTVYDGKGRPTTIEAKALGAGVLCEGTACDALEEEGSKEVFGYDARGNTISVTATAVGVPAPRTTTYQYDVEGVYLVRVTDPLAFSDVALLHPALGVPVFDEDEIGIQGTATYDAFGRLVSSTRPGSPTVTRSYTEIIDGDRRGLRVETSATDGSAGYLRTDELGREIETSHVGFDGDPVYVLRHLDAFGNVVRQGQPASTPVLADASTAAYDRLGRTRSVVDATDAMTLFTHPAYDAAAIAAGELETVRMDPEGHKTSTTADLDGRVIRSGHSTVVIEPHFYPHYGTLFHDYGPFDQPVRVTDFYGNVTTHHYDSFGRRDRLEDPDTGTSEHAYNGFGEVISTTSAEGITAVIEYDTLGRWVKWTGPDGAHTRQFGTTGTSKRRLVLAVSADGVATETDYDVFGRPHEVRQTVDGETDRVNQLYDAQGRPLVLFYPEASGFDRFTTYLSWGSHGYLESIDDITSCGLDPDVPTVDPACQGPSIWKVLARDADDALTSARLGPNLVERRRYHDVTGNLEELELGFGFSPIHEFTYTHDADGLLTTRTDGGRVESFEHDPLHRLTRWSIHIERGEGRNGEELEDFESSTGYSYDQLGNLLDVKRGHATVWSGDYDLDGKPHTLDERTVTGPYGTFATSFKYDDAGRQTSGANRSFAWTQDDMPRTIEDSAGGLHKYSYGTGNERVVSDGPKERVTYLGKLYERHLDVAGDLRHTFLVHADTGIVAQKTYAPTGDEMHYVVNDDLGSAVLVVDDYGIGEKSYFAPFGSRVNAEGEPAADPDTTSSFGFTGHEEDSTALINMNGRLYDPDEYRFVSPDPIIGRPLFGQNHNPYSYVMNSPLFFTDPSGFDPPDYGWGFGGSFDGGRFNTGGSPPPAGYGSDPGSAFGNGSATGSGGGSTYVSSGRPTDDGSGTADVTSIAYWVTLGLPTSSPAAAPLYSIKGYRGETCSRYPAEVEIQRPLNPVESGWGFWSDEWGPRTAGEAVRNIMGQSFAQRHGASTAAGLHMWAMAEFGGLYWELQAPPVQRDLADAASLNYRNPYRMNYNAWRVGQGRRPLPPHYDAHHRIPQEYRNHPQFKGFNFDHPSNIRGVKSHRSPDGINIHGEISEYWRQFQTKNPQATRAQIEAFAKRIDESYRHWYYK